MSDEATISADEQDNRGITPNLFDRVNRRVSPWNLSQGSATTFGIADMLISKRPAPPVEQNPVKEDGEVSLQGNDEFIHD